MALFTYNEFNYPVNPTCKDKKNYKEFMCHLKNVLPCGKCRKNFVQNLKSVPLNRHALKNRKTFPCGCIRCMNI